MKPNFEHQEPENPEDICYCCVRRERFMEIIEDLEKEDYDFMMSDFEELEFCESELEIIEQQKTWIKN